MKILVIGNVFKDIYLNIDERNEHFENDGDGTKWLNLGFNASEHRFFSRTSSYGGAAISLEVLGRLGLDAELSGSTMHFIDGGIDFKNEDHVTDLYRYILVSDERTTYFAPSFERNSKFKIPDSGVDYIFVDRSAKIDDSAAILDYLDFSPTTKLVVYVRKNGRSLAENDLLRRADLIFTERPLNGIDMKNIVTIKDNSVLYRGVLQEFNMPREELMTHLSIYSILSATILGCLILGKNVQDSLKIAKINVEHSALNACLDLASLEELASSN